MENKLSGSKREFAGLLWKLSLPIVVQMSLTSSLTYIDTLMIGQLNEAAVAAAGIANQFVFIFFVIQFGVHSGVSIFTAQYWGQGNIPAVRKLLGISLLGGLFVGIWFAFIAVFKAHMVISFFSTDPAVKELGTAYLTIVGMGFPAAVVILGVTDNLRSTGVVRLPLVASSVAVALNLLLNYALIFGNFGFPALGIQGAAIATCTAKWVEAALLMVMVYVMRAPCAGTVRELLAIDRIFMKQVAVTCWPVMCNEFFWVIGTSLYKLVYARMGTESMAAVSIVSSIEELVLIPFFGMFRAGSVILGNSIGAGNPDQAFRYGKYLLWTQLVMALCAGLFMAGAREVVLGFYNVSDATYANAYHLMLVAGLGLCLKCSNFTLIVSVLRGGGDTRFGFLLDLAGVWCIGVPMAFFAAFALGLPVYWVMALVFTEEVFKLVLGIRRFLSGKWLRNLVAG